MKRLVYDLDLTVQAPFLSRANGAMSFGLDMAMLTEDKQPVLLGSLLRGNLHEALVYFAKMSADKGLRESVLRWFGDEGDNDERGALTFDYYWRLTEPSTQHGLRHRIGIDTDTGTVTPGNLQVIEERFALGSTPVFSGQVVARVGDKEDEDYLALWLNKALAYVPALGALKSVGYGKLLRSALRPGTVAVVGLKARDPSATRPVLRLGLVLRLDRPFCVARPHRPDDNRFVGEDVIPGNVIKGALAASCGLSSTQLAEQLDFDQLVFTHAQPALAAAPARGLPIPLSVATFGKGQVRDLARQAEPCLLAEGEYLTPPSFALDWKDEQRECVRAATADWLAPTPGRLLAVRTAIHAASGASDEGKLFSQECVTSRDGDNREFVWCLDVDLSAVDDAHRANVLARLLELLSVGIDGIGKTKAQARVEVAKAPFLDEQDLDLGEQVIVTLRSPARLLKAKRQPKDWRDPQALTEEYRAYWQQVSAGALGLSHHFSRLSHLGGGFYFRRYRADQDEGCYRPEWVCDAGSVFVLNVKDATKAAELLAAWRRRGLPPAADREDEDWTTDPFIGVNGFGEIAIDHPLHAQLAGLEEGQDYAAAR